MTTVMTAVFDMKSVRQNIVAEWRFASESILCTILGNHVGRIREWWGTTTFATKSSRILLIY